MGVKGHGLCVWLAGVSAAFVIAAVAATTEAAILNPTPSRGALAQQVQAQPRQPAVPRPTVRLPGSPPADAASEPPAAADSPAAGDPPAPPSPTANPTTVQPPKPTVRLPKDAPKAPASSAAEPPAAKPPVPTTPAAAPAAPPPPKPAAPAAAPPADPSAPVPVSPPPGQWVPIN